MDQQVTDRARKVVKLAREEALRFRHECVGTEHILLSLVNEGSGIGARVLRNLGVDQQMIRQEVEKLVKGNADTVVAGRLPLTPRAKRSIELSIVAAKTLGHRIVGTEHILLGLILEDGGVTAHILVNLGLTIAAVRERVCAILADESGLPKNRVTARFDSRPMGAFFGSPSFSGPAFLPPLPSIDLRSMRLQIVWSVVAAAALGVMAQSWEVSLLAGLFFVVLMTIPFAFRQSFRSKRAAQGHDRKRGT